VICIVSNFFCMQHGESSRLENLGSMILMHRDRFRSTQYSNFFNGGHHLFDCLCHGS
jgi:hypothetical protein